MNSSQSVPFLGFEDLQHQLSQLMQRYFIVPVLIRDFEQICHNYLWTESWLLSVKLRENVLDELQHLLRVQVAVPIFVIVTEDGLCGNYGHLAFR